MIRWCGELKEVNDDEKVEGEGERQSELRTISGCGVRYLPFEI